MTHFPSNTYINHVANILKAGETLAEKLADLEMLKARLTEAKSPAVS